MQRRIGGEHVCPGNGKAAPLQGVTPRDHSWEGNSPLWPQVSPEVTPKGPGRGQQRTESGPRPAACCRPLPTGGWALLVGSECWGPEHPQRDDGPRSGARNGDVPFQRAPASTLGACACPHTHTGAHAHTRTARAKRPRASPRRVGCGARAQRCRGGASSALAGRRGAGASRSVFHVSASIVWKIKQDMGGLGPAGGDRGCRSRRPSVLTTDGPTDVRAALQTPLISGVTGRRFIP